MAVSRHACTTRAAIIDIPRPITDTMTSATGKSSHFSVTGSPLTTAILGAVDTSRSGIASAVNNAVSRVAGLLVIAMLATIVGGSLDLPGFYRAAVVAAAMMAFGGLVSFLGIRNPKRTTTDAAPAADSPA